MPNSLASIENLRTKLDKYLVEYTHACRRVEEEDGNLFQARQKLAHSQEAQCLIQEVAERVQTETHSKIASVVTTCLKSVFGKGCYEFKIIFEKKRGKTEARLVFLREGIEIDPLTSSGGGIVDLASFALRVACLVLSTPEKRRLLALDEPMKYLSKEFRPAFARLLETLSEELELQILLITHDLEFQVGEVIEIT